MLQLRLNQHPLAEGHHRVEISLEGDGARRTAAGDLDRAAQHYRKAVQLDEKSGNLYGAANSRFNMAIDLFNAGRRKDALEYAEAALQGYESYGVGAAEMIERTRGLIAEIRGG